MREALGRLFCAARYHPNWRYRPVMQYFMSGGLLYVRERCVRWPRCTEERTRSEKAGWKRGAGVS